MNYENEIDYNNIFISYNENDKKWAKWIAYILEEEKYETFIQDWDIKPGNNFILEMHKAIQSRRLIAVVSENYLKSEYTQLEWSNYLNLDPTGSKRLVTPIRIEDIYVGGLLRSIVYIDLVGLNQDEARIAILKGISHERNKPQIAPSFPGEKVDSSALALDYPVINTFPDPYKKWTVISITENLDEKEKTTPLHLSIREAESRVVDQRLEENIFQNLNLIEQILNQRNNFDDLESYRMILEIVFPNDFRAKIKRSTKINLKINYTGTVIPWEGALAISTSQTSKNEFELVNVIRNTNSNIYRKNAEERDPLFNALLLVIVPENNNTNKAELLSVKKLSKTIASAGYNLMESYNQNPEEIVLKYFSQSNEILHIHSPISKKNDLVGIDIGNNYFISYQDFSQLEDMPKLVFINAQFQKRDNAVDKLDDFASYQIASKFANQLINLGVEAVIVTTLPVSLEISSTFITAFYKTLFEGKSFSDSVYAAREAVHECAPKISNLAAFQCWGNIDLKMNTNIN